MTLGQRFARLVTTAVVRRPRLWRLFRAPLRGQFERLAPYWDERHGPNHLASYEAALGRIAPPPRRALDLGTGTGDGAVALARRFSDAEVVGLDLAEAMVNEARRKLPRELGGRVTFVRGDAASLPFPDASFDLVAHANAIPFFDELVRVLRPSGWVVFAFSRGAATPIYVPLERLRAELERRGFDGFEEIAAGTGNALLARMR